MLSEHFRSPASRGSSDCQAADTTYSMSAGTLLLALPLSLPATLKILGIIGCGGGSGKGALA